MVGAVNNVGTMNRMASKLTGRASQVALWGALWLAGAAQAVGVHAIFCQGGQAYHILVGKITCAGKADVKLWQAGECAHSGLSRLFEFLQLVFVLAHAVNDSSSIL